MPDRRSLLIGTAAVGVAGVGYLLVRQPNDRAQAIPALGSEVIRMNGSMPMRRFGSTGLEVSEVGFGAWGIGGKAYGPAERSESLAALARAEELGCNLVDTAAVYGDSESVLGEFLANRRSRWIVSTKFSGQQAGMTQTLESQLRTLGTDHVDFYMIHWMPGKGDPLFPELQRIKESGKARFVGVSLDSQEHIVAAIANPLLDGFMVPVSLLDPDPFLASRLAIASSGKAVIARSSLKEGFLAGKFTHETRFNDPTDQRSKWEVSRIERTVDQVERFRFLEKRAGSLAKAAIAYPLSFPEISATVVGVKKVWEAEANFGGVASYRLSTEELERIHLLQSELGVRQNRALWRRLLAHLRT